LLAIVGIGLAIQLGGPVRLDLGTARVLTLVVIGGGFVAVIGGALRRAGTLRRITWLAGGMAVGVLALALR
jgi:hypothetical protein